MPRNEWKSRVIDALVVTWAYKKEHEDDPKLAVNDLILSEIRMALDPQISKEMFDALKEAFSAGAEWVNDNRPDSIDVAFEDYLREKQK